MRSVPLAIAQEQTHSNNKRTKVKQQQGIKVSLTKNMWCCEKVFRDKFQKQFDSFKSQNSLLESFDLFSRKE